MLAAGVQLMDRMLQQVRDVGGVNADDNDNENEYDYEKPGEGGTSSSHNEHLRLMVFELERLEPARLTDWVDVEARRMPAAQRLWGRFHAAVVVDVFGRMACVLDALRVGESLAVDVALLKFVKEAMPVLEAREKRRAVVEVFRDVCARYISAFEEGEDGGGGDDDGGHDEERRASSKKSRVSPSKKRVFGGLEDMVNLSAQSNGSTGHAVVSLLLPALETMFEIVDNEHLALPLAVCRTVAASIASVEEQVIWRLFESKNVSEQLLAVTSLNEILQAVEGSEDGDEDDREENGDLRRARIAWIRSSDIVTEMLKVNLHHAQYVEDMVALLDALSSHDLVDAGHVAQLWSMVQDEGTFEEIKSNVCQLLGFLATAMSSADTESFCQSLQDNCDTQWVEAKYIEEMLLAAAKHDTCHRIMVQIVDVAVGFCLDGPAASGGSTGNTGNTGAGDPPPNRTTRMRSGDLLLDMFKRYIAHSRETQNDEPYVDCMASVFGTCMQRIRAGDGESGPGMLLAPDASDLLQPLRLLLRIVTSKKLSRDELHAVYKVINDEAKFMQAVIDGYELNLVRMSHSPRAPELLHDFNAILKHVLSESNYYLEKGKLMRILGWATTTTTSVESSTYAWGLLTFLVQEEKGINQQTIMLFLERFMEQVEHLTPESWLCFTAYLASRLDYAGPEVHLPVADSYVDLIVMTDENHTLDIWNMLKDFLRGRLLECCETDAIAAQCSKLLSHVLITDMDLNVSTTDPHEVKATIESFKDKLMDHPDRVMMFLSDVLDAYDYRDFDDAGSVHAYGRDGRPEHQSQDASTFDNGDDASGSFVSPRWQGSTRPLYSCYKEWDISFRVVLKSLPMSPRPAAFSLGGQQSVEVSCPRNCMVADLRAIISQQASHLVGYMIPHANFKLHAGGKPLTSNLTRLFECVAEGGEVFAVFSAKASYRSLALAELQLSHKLAQDQWFFGSLMTLGDHGARPALELMSRLPICEGMVEAISKTCTAKNPEELGTSFMLYACRLMHVNISPMSVEGVSFCNVEPPALHMPASKLVRIMSQLYAKIGTTMGGELPRMTIHLLSWAIEQHAEDDVDQVDGSTAAAGSTAAVALKLMHDVTAESLAYNAAETAYTANTADAVSQDDVTRRSTSPSSSLSVEDVRFVTSGAMSAVLTMFKKIGSVPEEALSLLIEDLNTALRHVDYQVRLAGVRTARALFREHDDIQSVLLRDVIQGILLCDGGRHGRSSLPPAVLVVQTEPLQMCSWFINRMDASHNAAMLKIAESICERITRCLQDRKPISAYSKCLAIAVERVDAAELPSLKPLVDMVMDVFLYRNLATSSTDASYTATATLPASLLTSPSASFETSKYALDHQESLYRVLIACAMLSGECWKAFRDRLHWFFTNVSFPNLYNNSASEGFRSLDSYCGLLNGGATCYMNATFQQLYMMPRLRRLLLAAPVEEDPDKSSPVFEALRSIFMRLFGGIDAVVDPSCFWREYKDYEGNPVDLREHQDGYEFFTRLQDTVDEYLKSLGHEKIMRSVLGGSFNQIIEVPDHEGVKSEREEEFYQISVDVRGKDNLLESLESYVAPETLDGQNQWFCESLGHKVDAKKRTLIKKLPETLVFHLKRFEWDYETFQRFKIKDRFDFPTELDMGPYVDANGDGDADGEGHMYDLSGVVVHSGTAFAGHYYSYAKERETGKWYHFDDDSVTPWDVADIEQECFGGPYQPTGTKTYMRSQSAYMVIYDRRRKATEYAGGGASTFDAICGTIPATRLQELMEINRTELTKSTAFSDSLKMTMSSIMEQVESTVRGPQSSRKLKTAAAGDDDDDDDYRPAAMPLHNEVFHVSSRHASQRDIPEAVNEAVVLGLDYVCNIAVCGPFGWDPAQSIIQPLLVALEEPTTARYVLSQTGTVDAALCALASTYRTSRAMVREAMSTCVKAAIDAPECIAFLEKVIEKIKSALDTPLLIVGWRDLLGLLIDTSQVSSCARVLANYCEPLISFSDALYGLWEKQTKREREAEGAVLCAYAVMVCNLLRHHRLANDEGTRDVQNGNPFCISRERELGFEVSRETIGQLASIGMDDDALLLFLHFWSWESRERSAACIEALTGIDNLSGKHKRLVPLLVEYLRLEDGYVAARTSDFVRAALGIFAQLRGNGWGMYTLSIALAFVLNTTSLEPDTDLDIVGWARLSVETCSTLSRRLSTDPQFKDEWSRDCVPVTCDADLWRLYDPAVLMGTIRSLVPIEMPGDVEIDLADDVSGGGDRVDRVDRVDLVRASSDEKENGGEDEDSVKDIVLD